jgi:surface protein
MTEMFSGCLDLQSLNLSGWNTANVTTMLKIFSDCSSLQSLDLSGWNTAKVNDMSIMFSDCSSLQSLDLSGWNTANVTSMSSMFRGCTNLATIYVGEGWSTSKVTSSNNYMFTGCTSLVGGMGTAYDADHTDVEYARIDMGPSSEQPGYLTGRFNKVIAGNQWYFFASPVGTAPVNMDTLTDLYFYDEQDHYWRNKKVTANAAGFDFAIGKGYLGANANADGPAPDPITLAFVGTPITGETYNVPVTYHPTTSSNAANPLAGWNLVGNPFIDTAYLAQSYYVAPATGGANVIARTGPIACCEGVMVQAAEGQDSITFSKTALSGSKGGVELTLSQNVINRDGVSTGSGTLTLDNAIVSFNEGSALEKFVFNVDNAKLYIPQDGKDYAIVSVGRDGACTVSTEIPVNFKAEENGEYTITVNIDNVEMNYLHLIDNLTGNDVDMLALNGGDAINRVSTYTFKARTTDYESRFKLVFICGDTNDDNDGDNATFAFYSNGNWIIANEGEATLQVVDVMGRILSSETISGSINKTIDAVPGMYVLRLVNGNDVKTQKIVVK